MKVMLLGTLDTKGEELAFARECVLREGLEVVVVDAGSGGEPGFEPDIGRQQIFEAAGTTIEEIQRRGDRGHAVTCAARGAARLAESLAQSGTIAGILSLGGSAGTTIGTAAMRALPFGMPKVMVSTLASGQTRPYVAGSDLVLFPSVADVAGLNRVTRTVLSNAAAALSGMVRARESLAHEQSGARPLITATMFGVTTPCVTRARQALEERGYEVIVFHATGVGGQAMEGLIRDGQVCGVLDLTTTELADEVVGGMLSAGPDRLKAAIEARAPQVVSVGALDMVNFGPVATVPERFRGRLLHVHNPTVTLMRTTREENERIGAHMGRVLAQAAAPVTILLPLRGVSALDAPGKPFHDPEADAALFEAIARETAGKPMVRLIERDEHINDPGFADCAVTHLLEPLSQVAQSL